MSAASMEAVGAALMAGFAASPAVTALLGDPPRLYGETVRDALFPHVIWRRWQTTDASASERAAWRHEVTLEVVSDRNGAEEAQAVVGALAQAVASQFGGTHQASNGVRLVLVLPLLTDVIRSPDQRTFRGLVRLRVIAEPAP